MCLQEIPLFVVLHALSILRTSNKNAQNRLQAFNFLSSSSSCSVLIKQLNWEHQQQLLVLTEETLDVCFC